MAGTALVTGCSSGIGKELASQLHAQGWTVFVTARNKEALSFFTHHEGFIPVVLDVNNAEQRAALAEQLNAHGQLDLLVNNAGYGAMGPVIEMPPEALQLQFATNVFAPLALAQLCFPLLRRSQNGRIVNLGSISGLITTPFSGAYCATKAALHSLSDAMRMELAPFGIEVITIMPGAIESEFGNNAARSLADTLPANSVYQPVKQHIAARANASQQNSTPTVGFVAAMVNTITQPHPPAEKRLGNGSTTLPLLKKLLPLAWVDKILQKKFGLNQPL
ncbi:MAG TPA: SDR family oxidoreductase [Alcanivoracaceae bacterium]|nr:SDR family oxidoreductase [Alcanivoracaceae bacterium]